MPDLDEFSDVVGAIYDAALDPALWPRALQQICHFVPGSLANVFVQDSAQRSANAIFTWGDDPYWHQLYLEKYAKINPLFPGVLFRPVEEVFSVSDIIPLPQLKNTPFYKEWQGPQGLGEALGAVLEKSSTSCAVIALPRLERTGEISEADRARMRLVVPHVRRAVLIGKTIELHAALAGDLADAVDGLRAAVYLLDADLGIRHANRSGLALLADKTILDASGRRLRAADRAADRALREAIAAIAAGDDVVLGKRGIALHVGDRSGEHYVVHVLPLCTGARRGAARPLSAVAAAFVQKASLDLATVPEQVADAYGLTPGEVAVLFAIVEMGGGPTAARVLGIAPSTVKTHLGNIFAKTGARRQADLVRIVDQFAGPLG
jgi:DNA-binding NarL/FixJ family response regulator